MCATSMSTVLLLLFLAHLSMSGSVTIDDEYGDESDRRHVTYSPPDTYWTLGTQCTDCVLHPNVSLAFDGTWHDSTYHGQGLPPSMTFLFDGKD